MDSLHNESPPSKTARLIPLYKVIAGSSKVGERSSPKELPGTDGIEAATVEIQVNGENRHRVQAGAFSQRSSAEARFEEEIRKLGITDGFIVYG